MKKTLQEPNVASINMSSSKLLRPNKFIKFLNIVHDMILKSQISLISISDIYLKDIAGQSAGHGNK